jgi:hypothetical protein
MEIEETKKLKKNLLRFLCKSCDFKCYMKCDWDRHLLTAKHTNAANGNGLETKKLKKTYFCDCGRLFLSNSGLWKHKKGCNNTEEIKKVGDAKPDEASDKDLIMMLVKQNTELLEVIKNGTHNTTNSHNNSHNKTFNLQFFLNETCKDAMNLMDFVESIQLQLTDLEKVGKIGYVEGISNIITTNLKALDITQRPIHCTDNKREILYIKDEDKWEKEVEEKNKIRKAIKQVAHKNIKMIQKFKEIYPDCIHSNSNKSDQYNKIIIESMGGFGDNDTEKEYKIIKNIAKGVVIEKT